MIVAAGAVAARWVILPRMRSAAAPPPAWMEAQSAELGVVAGWALVPALGLFFVRQLLEFRDPFAPWSEDAALLLGTPWGRTWMLGVACASAVLAGFLFARAGRRAGWWLASAATLALGAFPALTGHASGTGDLAPVTIAADTLHVLAAGAWAGGLTLVLVLELRWRRGGEASPASLLPVLVPAFSPMAVACVATLVLTGTLAAWVHVPSFGALAAPGYGRLLSLKLLLAAAVFALGWANWRRVTPRLDEPAGVRTLRRTAAAELLLAHVVLFVTAVLVSTEPPTG